MRYIENSRGSLSDDEVEALELTVTPMVSWEEKDGRRKEKNNSESTKELDKLD